MAMQLVECSQLTPSRGVEEDFHQIGLRIGSYGAQQAQYTAGLKKDKTTAIFHLNHAKAKGYRDNSQFENNMFNAKVRHHFSPTLHAMLQFNATKSPYAQDAGGQTIEEFNNNRRSARDRNLQYKTGEKIAHYKSGATISYQKGKIEGALYGFIAKRNFEGKLPFANGGWVDLNRRNTGQGGSFSFSNKEQKLGFKTQLSYDIATQRDLRKRFVNSEGVKGELTLDQKESFNSFGVALIQHLTYGPMVFNGGLRWDANELKVDDYFLNDGNDTAARTLNAWSPQAGITYTFFPGLSGFGNLSKSYETPTLSELSANPNGNGGFNPLIDIQVAENLEWGVHFTAKKTKGSLVYFNINTTNDLVAYELADSPGRTFYQNAGSTKREGIELLLQHQFSQRLSANLTYNSASFTYKNFEQNGENYAGNRLPGIPKNFGVLRLTYQWKNGPLINYSKTYRSDLYADNNNATRVDSFYRDDINLSIPLNKINDKTAVFFRLQQSV